MKKGVFIYGLTDVKSISKPTGIDKKVLAQIHAINAAGLNCKHFYTKKEDVYKRQETGLGTIATASDFGIRLPQEANSISSQHKESKPFFISVLVFLGLYITTRYRPDKRPARQSI